MASTIRKPAAVNKLNGNPGCRKRSLVEPEFDPSTPEPPFDMPDVAMEHWHYNIKQFESVPGMLTSADRDLLAQYCLAWQEYYDASQEIDRVGLIVHSKEGAPYQNPAVGIRHKATAMIITLGARFCLSPSDRVGKSFGDGKPKEDALTLLLKKREKAN